MAAPKIPAFVQHIVYPTALATAVVLTNTYIYERQLKTLKQDLKEEIGTGVGALRENMEKKLGDVQESINLLVKYQKARTTQRDEIWEG